MSKTKKSEAIPKELQLKRENHYVWANYLKNWSINNLDVWHTTKKRNIAYDSVKAIVKEKDLYRARYLSKQHIEMILFFSAQSPKELQTLHKSFLKAFLQLQEIEKIYLLSNTVDKKIVAYFEAFKSNTLENIHTAIENDVHFILKELSKQNFQILEKTENMIKFTNFWGHQIARTTPFREKAIASQTNQKLKNIYNEAWWFMSYMFGMNIGKSFFETRNIDHHCLLINESGEDFITSDHPIINVHPSINENDITTPSNEEADFFYAISPKLGYMINKSDLFQNGVNYVSADFVKEMNKKLASFSDQYIISTTENQLKLYKCFVGKRLKLLKETLNK
jgi:hypothetical protein